MNRYVDADAIKDKAWKAESEACFYALEDVVSVTDIDEAPSIDIVRCQVCKWYEDPDHKIFENCVKWEDSHGIILPTKPIDFCSYGEREGE